MRCQDIILHLIENLPKYTDLFSSFVNPESMSISGDTITVTKTAHGLTTGNAIVVTEGAFENTINNLEQFEDCVLLTSDNDHDLTYNYQQQVKLTSVSDPSVDAWYDLVGVPNRTQFKIPSFPDTRLEDVILNEFRELGINGLYTVTVIDQDSYTYQIEQDILVTMSISTATKIHTSVRVSGAATIDRCVKAYELQAVKELWGYVVLGENAISKDRYVSSDADLEQGGLNEWNGLYLSPFSFYVFVPQDSQNEITGRAARDTAEDVRPAIFRSLLNAFFETGFENLPDSNVSPQGDGIHLYQRAYYVHRFDFVQVAQISVGDTNFNQPTRNWTDLQFDFYNVFTDNGEVIMSTKIDLDEGDQQ